MFNISGKYRDQNNTRDTKIRLLAREKPTWVKPNNNSLIESNQMRYPRPRPRPNCHQETKSKPSSKSPPKVKVNAGKSAPISVKPQKFKPTAEG